MSWREVLGTVEPIDNPYTQKPQNTHKCQESSNSADIANSAEGDSILLETLSTACAGLSISPIEVRDALAPEDIKDWRKSHFNNDTLAAFARSLIQRREMNQGKVPAHFTEQATCKKCGPIWLWFDGVVSNCPWCINRIADRPIHRPHTVCCCDCIHFEYTAHPHLGHCTKGKQEAIVGLWDTDHRHCNKYMPQIDQPGDNHE